jgi:hypothetical protein
MLLFSGSQIVNSHYSDTFDFDSCSIQDRRTGALLGAGSRRTMMASGSLTAFVFPPLRLPPVSRPLLPPLLALFSSGIIALDIYVVLASRL